MLVSSESNLIEKIETEFETESETDSMLNNLINSYAENFNLNFILGGNDNIECIKYQKI